MFKASAPVAEPAADAVDHPAVPTEPVPVSVLELDLPAPVTGWLLELDRRGISVLTDDIGRKAISRADAKMLLDEQREAEARKQQVLRRQEQQAVEADRQWRSTLPRGVSWLDVPAGVLPVVAMTAADRAAQPKRLSPLQEALSGESMTYHSYPTTPEDEAS